MPPNGSGSADHQDIALENIEEGAMDLSQEIIRLRMWERHRGTKLSHSWE